MLSKEDEATADFVVTSKLTKAQLRGDEEILIHQGASRKLFIMGEPLIWPELLHMLPMKMHELHQWYMKLFEVGNVMFSARIQDMNFHRGMDDVWIKFENLWFSAFAM